MTTESDPDEQLWEAYCRAKRPAISKFLQDHPQAYDFSAARYLLSRHVDDKYGPIVSDGVPAYEVVQHLGQGGSGDVYKVRHKTTLDYTVIKFGARAANSKQADDYIKEARRYQLVNSTNVCDCNGFGFTDKHFPYIELEWIDGLPLSQELETQPNGFAVPRAVRIARGIAKGLADIHVHSLVHRDIKPGNIMIARDGDRPVLVDLGIAIRARDGLEANGWAPGTRQYTSPEQLRGDEHGLKSDIYSFGLVLWEMLTGHPLPREADRIQAAHAERHFEPADIAEVRADVPKEIAFLLKRCLAPSPEERPEAKEIYEELDKYVDATEGRLAADAAYCDQSDRYANECLVPFTDLARELDNWVANPPPATRLLCITANPGDGKTHFVSWWSREHTSSPPLLTWLCNRLDHRTLDPRSFVPALIHKLQEQIATYRYPSSSVASMPLYTSDPYAAVVRDIIQPLASLQLGDASFVIIVDGLDELDGWDRHPLQSGTPRTPSLARIIACLSEQLPSSFRIITTSQPRARALEELPENKSVFRLEAGDMRGLLRAAVQTLADVYAQDLRFRHRCQSHGVSDADIRIHASIAAHRADGNMLCAKEWFEGVLTGHPLPTDYDFVGASQESRFKRICGHKWPDSNFTASGSRDFFGVLVAAQQNLPAATLHSALPNSASISAEEVAPFAHIEANGRTTWRHDSYREYFRRFGTGYTVDEADGHRRLARACEEDLRRTGIAGASRQYALQHYGLHCLGAGELNTFKAWYEGDVRRRLSEAGNDNALANATLIELKYLRTHSLMTDDLVCSCSEAWADILRKMYRFTLEYHLSPCMPAVNLSTILDQVAGETVEICVQRGLLTTLMNTSLSPQQIEERMLGMELLMSHPSLEPINTDRHEHATEIVSILIALFLCVTGHWEAAWDDPVEVLRDCGDGEECRGWILNELWRTINGKPRLVWVETYFGEFEDEADQEAFGFISVEQDAEGSDDGAPSITICDERLASYALDGMPDSHDRPSSVDTAFERRTMTVLLTTIYIMAHGWVPDYETLPDDGDAIVVAPSWRACGSQSSASVDKFEVIEGCGGLDGLDAYIRDFSKMHGIALG